MTIHHRTATKAANKGIMLEEATGDFQYRAFWEAKEPPVASIEFWGNDASALLDAMVWAKMMVIEIPGLSFEQDDSTVKISFGHRELGEVEDLTDLASTTQDLIDELTDEERAEALEAEEEAEEEERGGSVVPDHYKRLYREAGHEGNCGDWLALTLVDLATGKDGKLDVDAMDEIARLNNVDTSALNRTTRGWQGRFRMTARNMLVKKVAVQGFLNTPAGEHGDSIRAPAEWCLANAPKAKEAGTKRSKAV